MATAVAAAAAGAAASKSSSGSSSGASSETSLGFFRVWDAKIFKLRRENNRTQS